MRDTTTTRKPGRPWDEDTAVIFPDKSFLGASETDIIAIERETNPRATSRRRLEEPPTSPLST